MQLKFGVLIAFVISMGHAQDTRTVTEPSTPAACATLMAELPATLSERDESKPDTARIQKAMDTCPAGRAVLLKAGPSGKAFLSGPLQLRRGVTVVVDSGAILYESRNPRDFDLAPGACGTVTKKGHGCKALFNGDHADNAGVMGAGVIDGRGNAKLLGQNVSWWDLAQEAKVKNLNQSCPRIMQLSHCNNFTLYRITMKNSPNFHVAYSGGNGFTAWGVMINTPKSGRNTDGIDPGNSTNVTITHCYIHTGDDNVAIKAGAPGPTTHMTISHNHFYTGHGMSIGSETDGGASDILVTDLSIDGADNGLRIKSNSSRGGLVKNIVYEDVCIRDTKNPIYMDSNYSFFGEARDKLPMFTGIVMRNVRIDGGGKLTLQGFDPAHRLGIEFQNVHLTSPGTIKTIAIHADVAVNGANFHPTGEDVKVIGKAGEGTVNACQNKFVLMPE
jgi:polygalacturonase